MHEWMPGSEHCCDGGGVFFQSGFRIDLGGVGFVGVIEVESRDCGTSGAFQCGGQCVAEVVPAQARLFGPVHVRA